MKSRKCGKFILTCVVLLGWLSVLSGISAGKYDELEGNTSRGNMYYICLLLSLLLSLRSCVVVKMYSPLRRRFVLDFGKQTAAWRRLQWPDCSANEANEMK